MRLLVTGGTGYIGSHFVVEAIQAGHECIILDNLSNSNVNTIDKIKQITGQKILFFEIDLRDKSMLDHIFQDHKFDAVVHFAGLKAVGESVQHPILYYDNNITGSINLFDAMSRHDVRQLIFSSSATVYYPDSSSPIAEDNHLGCTNPYGWTKLVLEQMIEGLCQSSNLKAINLRYFNPIGAHPSGLIGELPNGTPNNLMPYVMKVLTGELKQLQIFGSDYDTVDGTGVRDYIHVIDLVRGHLSALTYLEKIDNHRCEAINLGTGRGTSVLELIAMTEQITDQKIPYQIVDRRPGDIGTCFCNPNKARTLLGRETKETITQGITDMRKFYQK